MKKIFAFLLLIQLHQLSSAQYVPIADQNFRSFLMSRYPSCFNAANEMDTTCTAIITEDSLRITWGSSLDISEIRYFDNLSYLHCEGAYLPGNLPSSLLYIYNAYGGGLPSSLPPNLVYANFSNNIISEPLPLNYFPNSLQYLILDNNEFVKPLSGTMTWPTSLKYLNVSKNKIADLGILPGSLDTLICSEQAAEEPFFSRQPSLRGISLPDGLKYLDCSLNGIITLSLPSSLTWLNCVGNTTWVEGFGNDAFIPSLTSLGSTLPPGLKYLNCGANALTSLPPLPPSLEILQCARNRFYIQLYTSQTTYDEYQGVGIQNLGVLPPALQYIDASENLLDTLHPLPASLRNLTISNTTLEYLPALPAGLTFLDINETPVRCIPELPASMGTTPLFTTANYNLRRNNLVSCIPNSVPGLRVSGSGTMPVCTVLNNPNGCTFSPVATGLVFYDINNNGIRDAGEMPRQGVKISIDRGETGFTDLNGKYALACSQGSNVLTVTPPLYYNAVPATINYTLNAGDTLIYEEIALQANTSVDSVRVMIIPMNTPRPGFDYNYHVKYENVGTTTLNTTIAVEYPDASLIYSGSSNPLITQAGNILSLAAGSLIPGGRGDFVINFQVSVSAPLGTMISTEATATATNIVGMDIAADTVQGSFDPNDKNGTSSLTPDEVSNGKLIDYMIRFQNTGTDTAFRVFVTDTLSNLLQYESFEMIEASHACKTILDSIYLSFEFENILLPDSNVNEPKSHGFVRFRVKPVSTLALNDEVRNKASIYFDYNVPVVTNEAVTKVTQPAALFALLNFSGELQPPGMVRLDWSTVNEHAIDRFVIFESLDGTNRYPVDTIDATGGSSQSYSVTLPIGTGTTYYWLQTQENNGGQSFSNRISFTVSADPVDPPLTTSVRNNPVRGILHLEVADQTLINTLAVLINSEGRIVKRFVIKDAATTLNVSDLAAGVYFLKMRSGTKRILIVR